MPASPGARKRFSEIPLLILALALLSLLSTYLISKISWIGKVGIATVHKEYRFLRSGWRTFALLFGIQLIVLILLNITEKKYPKRIFNIVASILLIIALLGLAVTFQDFLHTYTHRILKERFHLGFYLFWFGWIGTCIFFFVGSAKRSRSHESFPLDPNTPVKPNTPIDPNTRQ